MPTVVFYRLAAVFLLLLALSGCAAFGGSSNAADCRCADNESADALRAELNAGYSMMYAAAQGLAETDWITTVKVENETVRALVDDVAAANDEIAARFESLAADFPALALDLKPLPAIEAAARERARSEKIDAFLPVVGKTGVAYERSLLLTLRAIVGHQRLLAAAISEREPDPALQQVMNELQQRYREFDDRATALLEQRYFVGGADDDE